MNTICIIPARGGSKGLPRKNLLPLSGRPLLAWSILAARKALGDGSVYVTTDDSEIARVALEYGANVIERPSELAGDQASSESALIHALGVVRTQGGALPDQFVFLQCTSPLTTSEDISGLLETMESNGADSAFSATTSHRFLWKESESSNAQGINHDSRKRLRRQDMEPEFAENGALYAMETEGFIEHEHRFFGKIALHEMPEERSWEIDSRTDFAVAEVLMRQHLNAMKASLLPSKIGAVVFDFDGVMTNNKVITDEHGNESVVCDRSDGMGIALLRATGIRILVLSTEENSVVAARCEKLKIECIHGQKDKAKRLLQWSHDEGVGLDSIIYLGNDVNDVGSLEIVVCPVVVADAYEVAKQHALIVLENNGGEGAVRELCDLIAQQI